MEPNLPTLRRHLLPSLLALGASLAAQNPTASIASEAFGAAKSCYDEARDRLVVQTANGGFWEHDGWSWSRSAVATGPGEALLYDSCRQQVLVLGATLRSYDGKTVQTLGASPAAGNHVFDRTRCVLVGVRSSLQGGGFQVVVDETVPGSSSTTVATLPGSRLVAALAYESITQRTWIQSQVLQSNGAREMWSWDGQQLAGPFAYQQPVGGISFDPWLGRIVARDGSGTWQWSGTAWQQGATGPQPPAGGKEFDDQRNARQFWMAPDREDFVWIKTGNQWARGPSLPHPSCTQYTLTYDERRQRAILLGADSETSARQVHAEWDGNHWQLLDLPAAGPSTLFRVAQAYDAARGEVVVFGGLGTGPNPLRSDTWTWDGNAWRLAATTGPTPRCGAALTYDSARQRVVLVGGSDRPQDTVTLTDHWEWDGQSWQQITPNGPFFAYGKVLLGFDPSRNLLVAHDAAGTTFEFGAFGWQQVAALGPSRSPMWQLVWNPTTSQLEGLFLDAAFAARLLAWDGTSWVPTNRPAMLRAYDPSTGTALAHLTDRALVESASPAAVSSYGAGCGSGATDLLPHGLPRPGNAAFHVDLQSPARQRPAWIGLALAPANQALGNGCALLLQNAVTAPFAFTDSYGRLRQPLPLPNDRAFRGLLLHCQGAVLDPGSPGGLSLSHGLTLRLGD